MPHMTAPSGRPDAQATRYSLLFFKGSAANRNLESLRRRPRIVSWRRLRDVSSPR